MKKENQEALEVIRKACSVYTGQLVEHQAIQTALSVIEKSLTPSIPKVSKNKFPKLKKAK